MPLPLSLQAEPLALQPQLALRSCSCIECGHSQPDTGWCLPVFCAISSHSTQFAGFISDLGPESICKSFAVCAPSSQPYLWVIIQLNKPRTRYR